MLARLPLAARIGVVLILIGIVMWGSSVYWARNRVWAPLDVPVSLSQGHIQTPAFEIDVPSVYAIEIEVGRKFDFGGVPCLIGYVQCRDVPPVLHASWSLSNGTEVVAQGDSSGSQEAEGGAETMSRVLGSFNAGKGHYILDLDVLEDGSRLNPGAPHLVVFEAGDEHWRAADNEHILILASLLFIAAGASLIFHLVMAKRRNRFKRSGCLTEVGPQPRNLRISSQSLAPPTVPSGFHVPPSGIVGACFIMAGIIVYAGIHYWMATRAFVAVDMPIQLGPGHLRTGPFLANLSDLYSIWVDTDFCGTCDAGCGSYALLQTRWVLYKDGHVEAGSAEGTMDVELGLFRGGMGVYSLDIEVLKDASCLDARHPRLKVSAERESYDDTCALLSWLCIFSIGSGASLLVIAGKGLRGKVTPPVAPQLQLGIVGAHLRWNRRSSIKRPFLRPSWFGLIAANTFLLILIPLWVLQSGFHPVPKGLLIHLLKPKDSVQGLPWIEPLLVRVEFAGHYKRPNLYLNSRPVSWEELGPELKQGLIGRPPNWPVYLEGDPDLDWKFAVDVIDTIRGLQAQVVLLTTRDPLRSRSQLKSAPDGPEAKKRADGK